jgi:hypothetical protein
MVRGKEIKEQRFVENTRFFPKISVLTFIISFNSRGTVHKEFLPPGQTVNHAFYKDVVERLRKWVQLVRMDIAGDWVLHHNNVPAEIALSVRVIILGPRKTYEKL